mgnify:CR=1 FL=1|tara:strand:- start:1646 stop:1993 length:348 start_codon:yes stop_codon:yes gene_type:complete
MIGQNIRKLRELKGFSQENLAKEIGISQKQFSRIESESVSPTFNMMLSICKILDISIQELMDFDENLIFNNNSTNQQGGEFIAYNNTEIKLVKDLYEKLLLEKDKVIALLENKKD